MIGTTSHLNLHLCKRECRRKREKNNLSSLSLAFFLVCVCIYRTREDRWLKPKRHFKCACVHDIPCLWTSSSFALSNFKHKEELWGTEKWRITENTWNKEIVLASHTIILQVRWNGRTKEQTCLSTVVSSVFKTIRDCWNDLKSNQTIPLVHEGIHYATWCIV